MSVRFLFIIFWFIIANICNAKEFFKWQELALLPPVSQQTESLGVAAAFIGLHNDVLIIAGGSNFEKPCWENDKIWHRDIWVLVQEDQTYQWIYGGQRAVVSLLPCCHQSLLGPFPPKPILQIGSIF